MTTKSSTNGSQYIFESSATTAATAAAATENSVNSKEARKAAYNASTVESNTRESKALEERIQIILIMTELARDFLGHDSVGKSAVAVSRQKSVSAEIPPALSESNMSVTSPAARYSKTGHTTSAVAVPSPPTAPIAKNRTQKRDKNGDTKSHHQSRSATSILMAKTDKSSGLDDELTDALPDNDDMD
jgi:hypothetical protein